MGGSWTEKRVELVDLHPNLRRPPGPMPRVDSDAEGERLARGATDRGARSKRDDDPRYLKRPPAAGDAPRSRPPRMPLRGAGNG